MRSGVVVPVLALLPLARAACNIEPFLVLVGDPSVVIRCRFVVSVLGGGGSEARLGMALSIEARQRKDSPVP